MSYVIINVCSKLSVEKFDYSALCRQMAEMTAGMSGREVAKLGVAWQAAGYTSENGLLTKEMVLNRCEDAIKQHKQKVSFISFLNEFVLIFFCF